jgi:hypothetical protein
MLKIELLVFSGRDNPTWETSDSVQTKKIINSLAASRDIYSLQHPPSILGFMGIMVDLTDLGDDIRLGLPEKLWIWPSSSSGYISKLQLLRILLATAPAEYTPLIQTLNLINHEAISRNSAFLSEYQSSVEDVSFFVPGLSDSYTFTKQNDKSCAIETSSPNFPFWNNPSVLAQNNCYAYACNRRTNTFAQPGRSSGISFMQSLQSVIYCSQHDGLVSRYECVPDSPRFIIALVATSDYTSDWDYHWYRLHDDGSWGHKPGRTMATNRDNSGNIIRDPENCDRGNYIQWGGYFYVPPSMNIS